MIKKSVTPQDVVDLLNDALRRDHKAIQELYNHRVDVTYYFSEHETIQVRKEESGEWTLSFLGLINGMFGINDNNYGPIAVVVDDSDQEKIIKFEVLPE